MKNVVEFLTGEDLPQYDNTDNFGAKHDDANLTKAEKKAAKKADKKDDKKADKKADKKDDKKADKKTAKKADKKDAKKADKKADKKVAKKAAKAEQELLEEPMTVSRKPSLMTLATASRSASARGSLRAEVVFADVDEYVVENFNDELEYAYDFESLEHIFNSTAELNAVHPDANLTMFEEHMTWYRPEEWEYSEYDSECGDKQWADYEASGYTLEVDWDACSDVDYDALWEAQTRYDYVWWSLGEIVNATDYEGGWGMSYSYNSSSWNSSSWNSSSWNESDHFVDEYVVENFNEELEYAYDFESLEHIFNSTDELHALHADANLTKFEEHMTWYRPEEWSYSEYDSECNDEQWAEYEASDYTVELDWEACYHVDYDALYDAQDRYDYVWWSLGEIVNATDYEGGWGMSYNSSSWNESSWNSSSWNESSYNSSSWNESSWNSSSWNESIWYDDEHYNSSLNWTVIDNFDQAVDNAHSFQELERIYNQTDSLMVLDHDANLTKFGEHMAWSRPDEWEYSEYDSECGDEQWAEYEASGYTIEVDWDACQDVDYDALYDAQDRYDQIWQEIEVMMEEYVISNFNEILYNTTTFEGLEFIFNHTQGLTLQHADADLYTFAEILSSFEPQEHEFPDWNSYDSECGDKQWEEYVASDYTLEMDWDACYTGFDYDDYMEAYERWGVVKNSLAL